MARKKNSTRKKTRSLGKRLADEPLDTSKREWKKLGPIGKLLTAALVLSAVAPSYANQINSLPVVGPWLRPVTAFGSSLRARVR